MNLPKRCIATKVLLFVFALCAAALAHAAQVAGTVVNLSGPLLAKKADGTVKVLSVKSAVEQGDTLVTEKDAYARIRFIDNSEITLRPNSQMKIDSFSFEEDKQEKDSATFSLVKGGLRAVTGTLGKRSKERVGVNTPTATIGIRGTIFVAEYIPPQQPAVAAYAFAGVASVSSELLTPAYLTTTDAPRDVAPLEVLPMRVAQFAGVPETPASSNGRAPGLYVQVLDGMIHLTNNGGSQNFSAGQFGYVPSFNQPPVIIPANPGIQFVPPPSFSSTSGPQSGRDNNTDANGVECEVR